MADTPTTTQTTPDTTKPAASGDGTVYVRDQFGEIQKGPASGLADAIAAGATPLTQQEIAVHEAEKKYGGVGNAIAEGAINAADALTLGFGKGIASEIGGQGVRDYLHGLDLAHPTAGAIGTGIGIIAPALVGDEAGLAEGAGLLSKGARAVTAPSRAVSEFGGLFERGAKAIVGDAAESGIGRALQKGVQLGAEGGGEGIFYGLGQTYSDAQIQNHDLTAEQIMAGALHGGEMGFGLGAAFGALGSAGRDLLGFAAQKVGKHLDPAEMAGSLAYRATGAGQREARKLEAVGESPEAVGQFMLDVLPKYSDKPFYRMNVADMAEAARKVAKEAGDKIGAAIDDLATAAEQKGVVPSARNILDRVDNEVIAPLRALPGYEGQVRKLETYTQSFAEKSGVLVRDDAGKLVPSGVDGTATFKDLKSFREALDDQIFRGSKILSDDPIVKELRSTRAILEDEIQKQGADVAGKDWVERYEGAKKQYGFAKKIEDATDVGERRHEMNRSISLTDTIAASGGFAAEMAANSVGGENEGHGGMVKAGLHAAAMALAHKAFREHADQIGAYALDRIAKLQAIKAMAAKSDRALQSGLDGFFGKALSTAKTVALRTTIANKEDSFKQDSERVRQLATMPAALNEHIAHTVPPSSVAPNLGAVYAQKQTNAITWLNSQVPAGFAASPLTPQVKRPPPRMQIDAFNRKLDVYRDPIGTITKNMQRGTLTRDHVDALKNCYPALYADTQQKTMSKLAEMAADDALPDFRKRLQLGILLDIPADASLQPSFIASQQMLYQNADKASSQSAGNPPPAPRNQRGARESLAAGEDSLDNRES